MKNPLTLALFLRINTHSTLVADTCVDLLRSLGSSHVVKNSESQAHYPSVFKTKSPPEFNSGDMLFVSSDAGAIQENPSKNRILRVFTGAAFESDYVFTAFNRINLNTDQQSSAEPKLRFSEVIRDHFTPWVKNKVQSPFMFLAETRNPQVIVYSPDAELQFNWLAIHDEFTFILIATQLSNDEIQDLLMPHLPGAYVFCMSVSNPVVSMHPLFITQKFRRLEKSAEKTAGKLRALAGVEAYLDRVSKDSI